MKRLLQRIWKGLVTIGVWTIGSGAAVWLLVNVIMAPGGGRYGDMTHPGGVPSSSGFNHGWFWLGAFFGLIAGGVYALNSKGKAYPWE